MKYPRLSNEELQAFQYPNLMAELIESGYSICTCAEHMGLGRGVDDAVVWAKIKGEDDIFTSEELGLARLFGVTLEYLFDSKLSMIAGESFGHIRWKKANQRREKEHQTDLTIQEIEKSLREKPYLLAFMREAAMWTEDELAKSIKALKTA